MQIEDAIDAEIQRHYGVLHDKDINKWAVRRIMSRITPLLPSPESGPRLATRIESIRKTDGYVPAYITGWNAALDAVLWMLKHPATPTPSGTGEPHERPQGDVQWVREHNQNVWHFYPDGDFKNAACGHAPITGTPLVSKSVPKVDGAMVCLQCFTKDDKPAGTGEEGERPVSPAPPRKRYPQHTISGAVGNMIDENDQLRARIAALEGELATMSSERNHAVMVFGRQQGQLAALEGERDELRDENGNLKSLNRVGAEFQELCLQHAATIADLRAALAAERERWAKLREWFERENYPSSILKMDQLTAPSPPDRLEQTKPEQPLPFPDDFEGILRWAINYHSQENDSNTPDFLLAEYLRRCLDSFNMATRARDKWYGVELKPAYDREQARGTE